MFRSVCSPEWTKAFKSWTWLMENTQQRIGFNRYSTWFNDSHWLYSAFPTIDGPSVSTCCAWLSGCRWCISCWQRAPHGVPTSAFDLQAPGGSVWQTQQPKHSASVRSVRHILGWQLTWTSTASSTAILWTSFNSRWVHTWWNPIEPIFIVSQKTTQLPVCDAPLS